MPVHPPAYRRYSGRRTRPGTRWVVIARAGILARLRERRFLALLLLAWAPFAVRAVQTYVSTNFAEAAFLAPTASTFREFLDQQGLFVLFVTLYAGAGLIADDRRASALQIYLSKPIGRIEYIGGKLAVLVVFLAAITWLPAMLLLALQAILAGSPAFLRDNVFLLPAMTMFCVVQIGVASLAMLALSSLSSNRRFVAVVYVGIVLLSSAAGPIVSTAARRPAWASISPEAAFDAVADALFGVGPRGPRLAASLVVLAAIAAGALAVLERRVRAVDVVA